ncbi:hypothetical protein [Rhodococcus erythropolis]|uniref:RNase NYN domain-containing protein n=1 Tax=Rhodococcus erythropolis TaxID=1833 RepID=A0A8I0ZRE5_RHOER|nr:hypothetical protein [Rhodococcus erythropolis]MBH5141112.1 hypothetical protein [Rhodococcus erythropolis]
MNDDKQQNPPDSIPTGDKSRGETIYVVDGSNLVGKMRGRAALKHLKSGLAAIEQEFSGCRVVPVVDNKFRGVIHQVGDAEWDSVCARYKITAAPQGLEGRGDRLIHTIVAKELSKGGTVRIISNDAYRDWHEEYAWLTDKNRIIGHTYIKALETWQFPPRNSIIDELRDRRQVPHSPKGRPNPRTEVTLQPRPAVKSETTVRPAPSVKSETIKLGHDTSTTAVQRPPSATPAQTTGTNSTANSPTDDELRGLCAQFSKTMKLNGIEAKEISLYYRTASRWDGRAMLKPVDSRVVTGWHLDHPWVSALTRGSSYILADGAADLWTSGFTELAASTALIITTDDMAMKMVHTTRQDALKSEALTTTSALTPYPGGKEQTRPLVLDRIRASIEQLRCDVP